MNGNYYGTHRKVVEDIIKSGKICLIDTDVERVQNMIKHGLIVSNNIFIVPSSMEELKLRMKEKQNDTEDNLNKKINVAQNEIQMAFELKCFNLFIKNTKKEDFLNECKEFVKTLYPEISRKK